MTVQDIINYAKQGELCNLSPNFQTNEAITSHIHLGLLELYKRFNLNTKEHLLTMIAGTTIYTLPTDCMYIQEVYDESGVKLNINAENDELCICTPTYNTVQIPYSYGGRILSIIYAAEPVYPSNTTDAISLPSILLEPLLLYIGYRAHSSINGNVNTENNNWYTRFEASCTRVKLEGFINPDDLTKRNVYEKGFI